MLSILQPNQTERNIVSPHTLKNNNNTTLTHILSSNNISIPSNELSNTNISTMSLQQNDGRWLEMSKMDNFVDIFSVICSIAVIFGCLIPYVPQYLKIKRSMNSDGFSTYVCLTLLIANILRIMFWFGHRFELPLLFQSFVIIAGMLAMMEICVRVRDKSSSYIISAIGVGAYQRRRSLNGKQENNGCKNDRKNLESLPIYSVLSSSASSSSLTPQDAVLSCSYHQQSPLEAEKATVAPIISTGTDSSIWQSCNNSFTSSIYESSILDCASASQQCQTSLLNIGSNRHRTIKWVHNFWDWDELFSYVKFLLLFTFLVSLLTYLLLDKYLYVETLGYVAVFTESMLGMPQLLRNYDKKSTRGMSVEMVIMWLSGDLFKTLYFILRRTPAQFYVCGSIQVIVDILILAQVLWYRRANVTYRKLPKST